MTKIEILNAIDEEIKKQSECLEEDDEIATFIEEFLEDSQMATSKQYDHINWIKLMISYITANGNEEDFHQTKEALTGIANMINPYDDKELSEFDLYTTIVMLSDTEDTILKMLETPNSLKRTEKLKIALIY